MWTFEEPGFLLLLLLVPILVGFTHVWQGRGGRLAFPLGLYHGLRFIPTMPGIRLMSYLATAALWASIASLIVALSGPALTHQEKIYLNAGADIMIVLDESPSMGAKDFPPQNRFDSAKSVVKRFVQGRTNDLIGLISFGKEAALRVPLTLDYEYLLDKLDQLELMDLGDGTALGMGIAFAALHLQNVQAQQKVIIVLTDGVNNSGEVQPGTAADLVRSLRIPLYLIGIGSSGQVPIELTDPNTGLAYSGTLDGGFQEDYLKSLAVPPLGAYFSAGSPGSLETIFQAIDSRESSSKRVKVQVSNEPLYRQFLLASIAFVVVYFLVRKVMLKEIL